MYSGNSTRALVAPMESTPVGHCCSGYGESVAIESLQKGIVQSPLKHLLPLLPYI